MLEYVGDTERIINEALDSVRRPDQIKRSDSVYTYPDMGRQVLGRNPARDLTIKITVNPDSVIVLDSTLVTDLAQKLYFAIDKAEYEGSQFTPEQKNAWIEYAFVAYATKYWKQAVTLRQFRMYYQYDAARNAYIKNPNAPQEMPVSIKLPEVLVPGVIPGDKLSVVENNKNSGMPTSDKKTESDGLTSSPLIPQVKKSNDIGDTSAALSINPQTENPGGIDLRALPIVTQPMPGNLMQGQSPKNILGSVPLGRSENALAGTDPISMNLDAEWQQIENMVLTGLIPSNERIREYLEASCQSQDCSQRIDKVLSLLADILRLEEERVSSTEPALREMLVLLESDKSAQELQVAISKIEVSPKEPQTIEE